MYLIDYPLESGSGAVTVATVRPETMLADTAIAVSPTDERYSRLVGEAAILPLVGRRLPILADDYVDPEFGTGALKITPGHDPHDFEIGRRHGLEEITVIGEDGLITDAAPEAFRGMEVEEARAAVVAALREEGLISGHAPLRARRAPLPPLRAPHRAADLAPVVLRHVRAGQAGHRRRARRLAALPSRAALDRGLPRLAGEHPPVVHLAPALVGAPAPGLVPGRRDPRGRRRAGGRGLGARPGRARHLVLVRPVAVRHPRLARGHAASCRPSIPRTCSPRRATSSSSGWPGW